MPSLLLLRAEVSRAGRRGGRSACVSRTGRLLPRRVHPAMVKCQAPEVKEADTLNLDAREPLRTPAGRAALAEADALAPDEKTFLSHFSRLAKRHEPQTARAALATAVLRRR